MNLLLFLRREPPILENLTLVPPLEGGGTGGRHIGDVLCLPLFIGKVIFCGALVDQ